MAGFFDGETEGISIPYKELISDDWKDEFIQQVQKKQHEIKKKAEIRKAEVSMGQEKLERQLYEKLKMKYEGEAQLYE
ncbi:hypothetical protein [Hungatella hathewayi]|uniref:hypothetical protein n=1 Tax=Hungatella hathewayi TaxID=154046 RepID=UPI003563C3BF